MIKSIPISELSDNPYRPSDGEYNRLQIKKLMRSIEDVGLLPGVIARRVKGSGYELACGHHRREAMRGLKYKEMPVEIRDISDDDMMHILTRENALQRGGETIESVRAAQRRLAEIMLSCETLEKARLVSPNVSKIFDTLTGRSACANSYSNARAAMLKGEGMGERVLGKFLNFVREADDETNAVSVGYVRNALVSLRKSGDVTKSLEDMAVRFKEKGDSEIAKLARQAVKASQQEDDTEYDISCHDLFEKVSAQAEFRDQVTSQDGKIFIDVDEQKEIAKEIIKKAKARNPSDSVSRHNVRKAIQAIVEERAKKSASKEKLAEIHQRGIDNDANDAFEKFRWSLQRARNALKDLAKAMHKGGRPKSADDLHLLSEMEALRAAFNETIDEVIAVAPGGPGKTKGKANLRLIARE